jgi:3-oxoacyl-[acyl-carrier protein] reductase
MSTSKRSQNKTAIITGSGRGIGKETAILLAGHVANVVVCSRTGNEINAVVKEIEEIDDQVNVLGVRCDVSISSQVNSLVKSALDEFGSGTMAILVNNAGIVFNKKLIDTSEYEWDQTINTNLKGAFLFTKAVLPYMIERNSGVIINVNSGAGKVGFSNLSSYCASKFGLAGFAESLALALVATQMWQNYDSNYYERNKNKMFTSEKVAAKIVEMILDTKHYKNGDAAEMYST